MQRIINHQIVSDDWVSVAKFLYREAVGQTAWAYDFNSVIENQ